MKNSTLNIITFLAGTIINVTVIGVISDNFHGEKDLKTYFGMAVLSIISAIIQLHNESKKKKVDFDHIGLAAIPGLGIYGAIHMHLQIRYTPHMMYPHLKEHQD